MATVASNEVRVTLPCPLQEHLHDGTNRDVDCTGRITATVRIPSPGFADHVEVGDCDMCGSNLNERIVDISCEEGHGSQAVEEAISTVEEFEDAARAKALELVKLAAGLPDGTDGFTRQADEEEAEREAAERAAGRA